MLVSVHMATLKINIIEIKLNPLPNMHVGTSAFLPLYVFLAWLF